MYNNEKKGSEKMEKEFGTFRKSAFGGFNRKDVIDYIEKMQNETFEYKKQVEQTVSSLNEKIFELEKAAMLIEQNASGENEIPVGSVELSGESVGDIRDATKHLKSVADELCRSLSGFIEKLTQRGLFDANKESREEITFTEETKESDKVESILSVLSFLDKDSEKKNDDKQNDQQKKDSVTSILDGLSFLS